MQHEPVAGTNSESDLLARCEGWHVDGEHQRIINAIEAVPERSRTPAMVSILARAYNNMGGPDDLAPCRKAVELLESVSDVLSGDPLWNYRMGYAFYMMDQEPKALQYFERALEIDPDDDDSSQLADECRSALALPAFHQCFSKRVDRAWEVFLESEAEIRRMIDLPDRASVEDELIAEVSRILEIVFDGIAFEIGFNGERYEIVLSPDGNRVRLFELVRFVSSVPDVALEHWSFSIGRKPLSGTVYTHGRDSVSPDDVEVLVEPAGKYVRLTLHCSRLDSALADEEDRVWWMLSHLMEQCIGEIPAMAALDGFEVVGHPLGEGAIPLSGLREKLIGMGFNMDLDAETYTSQYTVYKMEPIGDPEAPWRADVITGSSRCAPLVNSYMGRDDSEVDLLHADGAFAGFLIYPLDSFTGDDRSSRILDYRDEVVKAIGDAAGPGAVTFIGGATGLHCGYVDFIAWDVEAVVDAAERFFGSTELEWSAIHSFRFDCRAVRITDRREVEPPEGPVLSEEDVTRLGSYVEDVGGYFGTMLQDIIDTLNRGMEEGRFTLRQAQSDLETALWYAYACLNIGDYEHYYMATRWMPFSEGSAKGCGTWFYRYSCALMYCGRLDEARDYAERGAVEEPDYPWVWLQVGKLRSHFGDMDGAVAAARTGLSLVPGDHEFLTLLSEIEEGITLDRMEYHWIDPDADAALQSGEDSDDGTKLNSIRCIITDTQGLESFRSTFQSDSTEWVEDSPYCSFNIGDVSVVFRTNTAAVSKMDPELFVRIRDAVTGGRWGSYSWLMRQRDPLFRGEGRLSLVLVDPNGSVRLSYVAPNGRPIEVSLDGDLLPITADGDD